MTRRTGGVLQMPNAIGADRIETALRLLGFTPHQVVELHIANSAGGLASPTLTVGVKMANQKIVRTYECMGNSPFPVHVLPEDENAPQEEE